MSFSPNQQKQPTFYVMKLANPEVCKVQFQMLWLSRLFLPCSFFHHPLDLDPSSSTAYLSYSLSFCGLCTTSTIGGVINALHKLLLTFHCQSTQPICKTPLLKRNHLKSAERKPNIYFICHRSQKHFRR